MIVIDTSVIAYLMIGGPHHELARLAFLKDPEWAAPWLWRSEFRGVLGLYMRRGLLDLKGATRLAAEAEGVLGRREYLMDSSEVLRLTSETQLSAYDAEFVALAQRLRLPLLTSDSGILRAVPAVAVSPEAFTKQ